MNAENKKLLAVDDSALSRRIVSEAAGVLGLETIEAPNGDDALSALDEHGHDIVIIVLDWHMPGMSGVEVLAEIKSDPRHKRIPVVMLTTEIEEECVSSALEAGATDYISKPFSQEDFITAIERVLQHG